MISIIVPVYNVEKYIGRCLRSILTQTETDLEIIIVDDGSTDNSLAICKKFETSDSRIKIITKKNGGLSSARNVGLKSAKGSYVLFVDSDDYISENAISIFQKAIKKFETEKIDIFVSDAVEDRCGKKIFYRHTALDDSQVYSARDYIIKAINKNEFYAPVCFNMYRVDFLKNNSLYFKEGILHEDMEYLPRVFLSAKNVVYVRNDYYNYIVRSDSIMTGGNYSRKMEDLFNIYASWLRMFDKIKDKRLKKKMKAVLSKYYKASCRKNHFSKRIYPKGISARFLITHCLNPVEFIKTIYFLLCRKMYVKG